MASRMFDTEAYKTREYRMLTLKEKSILLYIKIHFGIGGVLAIDLEAMSFWIGEDVTIEEVEQIPKMKVHNDYIVDTNFLVEQNLASDYEHINYADKKQYGAMKAIAKTGLFDLQEVERARADAINQNIKKKNAKTKEEKESIPDLRKKPKSKAKAKSIEDKEQFILDEMEKNKSKYPNLTNDDLNGFYLYWTEPNANGSKLKYELEKTFSVNRRLSTWQSNKQNRTNNQPVSFRQQDDNETIQAIKESQERMKAIQKMKAENIQGAISL